MLYGFKFKDCILRLKKKKDIIQGLKTYFQKCLCVPGGNITIWLNSGVYTANASIINTFFEKNVRDILAFVRLFLNRKKAIYIFLVMSITTAISKLPKLKSFFI